MAPGGSPTDVTGTTGTLADIPAPDVAATTNASDGAATTNAPEGATSKEEDEVEAALRPIHGLGPPPPVYADDGVPTILSDRKLYVVTSGRYVGVFPDW